LRTPDTTSVRTVAWLGGDATSDAVFSDSLVALTLAAVTTFDATELADVTVFSTAVDPFAGTSLRAFLALVTFTSVASTLLVGADVECLLSVFDEEPAAAPPEAEGVLVLSDPEPEVGVVTGTSGLLAEVVPASVVVSPDGLAFELELAPPVLTVTPEPAGDCTLEVVDPVLDDVDPSPAAGPSDF
jgi:hypothetical protein